MQFTLTIKCDNAAFDDEPLEEVARILDKEAAKMRRWVGDGAKDWHDTLQDINGNYVGTADLEAS